MAEDLPEILDAAQVAELLGMNVQMVRRYASDGRLPAYRLPGGRVYKFSKEEVLAFLMAHPVVPREDDVSEDQANEQHQERG